MTTSRSEEGSATLEFALRYAASGYKVLALAPRGKVPLTEHGAHDATTDQAKIRGWFEREPRANIGISLDGLVVVDVDPRNRQELGDWAAPGEMPDTCHQRTGGGGEHYLFRSSNGTRYDAHPEAGIDVKTGPGAYIVVEPSIHPSGERYVWLDESEPWSQRPAAAPDWLAAKVSPSSPALELGAIAAGARNSALTALAGAMRRKGASASVILAALEVCNREQCSPPLEGREVSRIAASVARYDPSEVPAAITPPESKEGLWPASIDLVELASREPSSPKFIIPDWGPVGYAWLMAGHGGVGKSGIALTLAVCAALGEPFFGLPVEPRKVLYLSCEDRTDVLHWRLSRICAYFGADMAALAGRLQILDLVGRETVLYERDPRTGGMVTLPLMELETRVREYGSQLVMVDGIADTYSGNENSRTEVKRYVNALVSLIPPDSCAAMLIGHIAKPSASSLGSEGYSGSTGWHNSVRARWYLYPETTQSGDDEGPSKTGELLLELQKSNLGRTDQSMRFRWDEQARLFVGKFEANDSLDRTSRDTEERIGIMRSIMSCTQAGITVPAAMTGPRTAYLVLSIRPEFPPSLAGDTKSKRYRFSRHLEKLRGMQHIRECAMARKDRHHITIIEVTTEGVRACG